MHYYSGPQLVEIFARKRRHKLGKYGALGSPEKKCAQGGGRLQGVVPVGRVQQKQDKGDSKC